MLNKTAIAFPQVLFFTWYMYTKIIRDHFLFLYICHSVKSKIRTWQMWKWLLLYTHGSTSSQFHIFHLLTVQSTLSWCTRICASWLFDSALIKHVSMMWGFMDQQKKQKKKNPKIQFKLSATDVQIGPSALKI